MRQNRRNKLRHGRFDQASKLSLGNRFSDTPKSSWRVFETLQTCPPCRNIPRRPYLNAEKHEACIIRFSPSYAYRHRFQAGTTTLLQRRFRDEADGRFEASRFSSEGPHAPGFSALHQACGDAPRARGQAVRALTLQTPDPSPSDVLIQTYLAFDQG